MSAQRERKEKRVAAMQTMFSSARIVVVTHYSGSSVAALTELREQLAANKGKLQITKNRLALRALDGTQAEPIKELLKGPTAVATAQDEGSITQIPKAIVAFSKQHEHFKVLGGAMDGALLDEKTGARARRIAVNK